MSMLRGLAALAALCLGGCLQGVLPEAAERAVYALPEATSLPAAERWTVPVLIALPRALAPHDGSDALVLRADGEFRVLPAVRWSAPLPELLQELLARQIELAGLAPVAVRGSSALAAPLRLQADLHAFELREAGLALRAHASLSLRLVCARDGRLLAASPAISVESGPVPAEAAVAISALREAAALLARAALTWLAKADVSACVTG